MEWNTGYNMPSFGTLIPRAQRPLGHTCSQSWVHWLMQQGSTNVMGNCDASVKVC